MLPVIVFVFLISYLAPIQPLPQGAPESVCNTMTPFHGGGIPALTTTPPFRIKTSATAVGQGQTLRVEIESIPSELSFGGFMIHARSTSPPFKVVGRFAPSADGVVKLINCDGVENTATHVNPSPKRDLGLEWQAPTDFLGEIVFNATIAQEYAKFWVGIESIPVQVVQRGAVPPATVGISTTRNPPTRTVPVYTPQTERIAEVTDPIYEGCGTTKSCFGFPDGCVSGKTCRAVASVNVRGERYEFEMKSGYNQPAYVAVGLSDDAIMGDDSVMACIPENGNIRLSSEFTRPRPNIGVTRDGVPQNVARLLEATYDEGTIYCKVERVATSEVLGKNFDLINNKYHLLLATGSSLKPNSVGYHDIGKIATGEPQFLSVVSNIGGASNLLLRLHAAFMLVAWIGTTSIGIILARYFKTTWVGSQLCGKDQWFAWHRMCMVLTWSLTIAAFVIIFVQLGGWSSAQNPHAILGTITTIICFLQPIGALFRPAPNSRNRPYFNWGHWLGGNLAHILSVVTIFFAVRLAKAELPEWYDWILVAFVAFHVLMHFIFSIAGCVSDRRSSQRVNAYPMSDMSPRGSAKQDMKMDSPFSGLRKILLTIYLVINILFVIALVVIAVLAPIEDTVNNLRTKLMN